MKVRLILTGLLIAQLADAVSFAFGIHHVGIAAEANAWARVLFAAGGMGAVLAMKTATIVASILILAVSAHRFPRLVVLGGATSTSLGLLGATANTLTVALAG